MSGGQGQLTSFGSGAVVPASARWFARADPRPVRVTRIGAIGALLQPMGIALALLLATLGALTFGTTFWRSYQRHVEHTLPVHGDRTLFDVLTQSNLPNDPVDFVIRDVDGKVRHLVAGKGETKTFVNETITMLDGERGRIKDAANADIDRLFAHAFADRDAAIAGYADWFFAWKRSYVVLKDTINSAITRAATVGEYETLTEAVDRDVKDYFMRHYKEQVLRPEARDAIITAGLESAVRGAHDSYRRVIANGDMRAQLFLAKHTQHLSDVPADKPMTQAKLDWDAQRWKAPVYLMEDRAFDGVAGLGRAAVGGTLGALALAPMVNGVVARSFGAISARFATSVGTRIAMAQQGAVAGTFVQPVGGQVVGALAGLAVGIAADYFVNRANEGFNREAFVAMNGQALDATQAEWKGKLKASVDAAIDRWFDDARSSLVLAVDKP